MTAKPNKVIANPEINLISLGVVPIQSAVESNPTLNKKY